MISSYGRDGLVLNNPDDLVESLLGGKIVISTNKDIGLKLSVIGESVWICKNDCQDMRETFWGTHEGSFFKNGSFIRTSGRLTLYPGCQMMIVQFDSLFMSSNVPCDTEFNFNADMNNARSQSSCNNAQFERPRDDCALPRATTRATTKPPHESRAAGSNQAKKKPTKKPTTKRRREEEAAENKSSTWKTPGPGRPPKGKTWDYTRGEYVFPGKEADAAGTKTRRGKDNPMNVEEFEEDVKSDKDVMGFPVYKVSTGKLPDGTFCKRGQYSFCARLEDFGFVWDSDAAAYKIAEPTPLGQFLMEQKKMSFFCCKFSFLSS